MRAPTPLQLGALPVLVLLAACQSQPIDSPTVEADSNADESLVAGDTAAVRTTAGNAENGSSANGTPKDESARQSAALEPFRLRIPATAVKLEFLPVPGTNYWLARTETTWDAYDVYTYGYELPRDLRVSEFDTESRPSTPYGSNDRGWGHRGYPALTATAQAAEGFAQWLSELTGGSFRLPSDAEWQAAALAGRPLPENATLEPVEVDRDLTVLGTAVGFSSYAGDTPQAVLQADPNEWGFLGMQGNVGEWSWSDRANSQAVLMGGHILDDPSERTAWRRELQQLNWNQTDPQTPKSRWWLSDAPFVGFRILCEQAPPTDGPAAPEPLTP